MAVFGRPAVCSPWLFEMLLLVAGVLRRLAEPIGNGPELVGLTVLPLVRKLVFGAGVMGVDPKVPEGTGSRLGDSVARVRTASSLF